jgi:rhodanese-related sulfurtransferase
MNRRTALVLAAFLAVGVALPASTFAQNYPPSVSQLVSATKKQLKTIDMAALKSALDRGDAGIVVDVREPGEYAEGHVPGAVNVPRGMLEFTIWSHVGYPDKTDMSTKLVVYCRTGGRSALAAKSLMDLGFTNVTLVDMKIDDWTKAGYPVAKG